MDRRFSLIRGKRAMGHALFACSASGLMLIAGCTHFRDTNDSAVPEQPAVAKSDDKLPRRSPRPESCVTLGDLRLQFASEEGRAPLEVERLQEEARSAYQHALRLDPKFAPAYRGLARLYRATEELDKSRKTLEDGIAACPKDSMLRFELGMMMAQHKNWNDAIANFQKASELEPEKILYLNVLGYALARAGRIDESFHHFEKSFGAGRAHYNVARILHHMKRDEESKNHVRLALQVRPNWELATNLLAEIEHPGSTTTGLSTASFEEADAAPTNAGPNDKR